jgi:hypothetical protein
MVGWVGSEGLNRNSEDVEGLSNGREGERDEG